MAAASLIPPSAKALHRNPRGVLLYRDELAGWLRSFDRYRGGGGDAERWLEIHGGRDLIVDRKTAETEYVSNTHVSICGGIQPGALRRSLGDASMENGLAARFLFVMPPRQPKRWTERDINPATEARLGALFDRLYGLDHDLSNDGEPMPRKLPLGEEAKRLWIEFVNRTGEEQLELSGPPCSRVVQAGGLRGEAGLGCPSGSGRGG